MKREEKIRCRVEEEESKRLTRIRRKASGKEQSDAGEGGE